MNKRTHGLVECIGEKANKDGIVALSKLIGPTYDIVDARELDVYASSEKFPSLKCRELPSISRDEVARVAPPIVVGRGGYGEDAQGHHDGVHIVMPELSSTRIRELAAAGRHDELASLVPRSVLRYIADNHLYSS